MNDTLKAAGRIGAELGAAKAEVERLRGLLHEEIVVFRSNDLLITVDYFECALSQQAEPVEPAPAQDELGAFKDWFDKEVAQKVSYGNPDILRRSLRPSFEAGAAWQRTRHAQTAPQPDSWQSIVLHASELADMVLKGDAPHMAQRTATALRAMLAAQPAEAEVAVTKIECTTCRGTGSLEFEGGAVVKDCAPCKGTGRDLKAERYALAARLAEALAALSAVTAERDRLRRAVDTANSFQDALESERDQLRAEVHANKWIPLSEATPPDGVQVLRWPGWAAEISIDEWCADYGCFLMSIEGGERATHWKPLSAPDAALAAKEAIQ